MKSSDTALYLVTIGATLAAFILGAWATHHEQAAALKHAYQAGRLAGRAEINLPAIRAAHDAGFEAGRTVTTRRDAVTTAMDQLAARENARIRDDLCMKGTLR